VAGDAADLNVALVGVDEGEFPPAPYYPAAVLAVTNRHAGWRMPTQAAGGGWRLHKLGDYADGLPGREK
jgi:hypothetical protein